MCTQVMALLRQVYGPGVYATRLETLSFENRSGTGLELIAVSSRCGLRCTDNTPSHYCTTAPPHRCPVPAIEAAIRTGTLVWHAGTTPR